MYFGRKLNRCGDGYEGLLEQRGKNITVDYNSGLIDMGTLSTDLRFISHLLFFKNIAFELFSFLFP